MSVHMETHQPDAGYRTRMLYPDAGCMEIGLKALIGWRAFLLVLLYRFPYTESRSTTIPFSREKGGLGSIFFGNGRFPISLHYLGAFLF